MSFRIGKRFTFEAAHQLSGLPGGHKCGRLHGHSYTVEVVLTATELSESGFVIDFANLDPIKRHLAEHFDHQPLNEAIDIEPTSENLARVLFEWCAKNVPLPATAAIEAVRVSETSATWAEYRPCH
ncbi:6-pyruvoyltetrahydropterin/6-carboxytetrahydropterin synthase [Nonomuraea solani]|uniref:6-carboxy-5,6,7,8-tetrahydropterin synthase n=1 Tax=Nonomuraea solani TaxID=1144553 RepID=A0A1H5T0K2_9ACTN|nr:6-carboxytetrahydropterin synthase QueD [Nonomuraea solani]SEF55577.1 6-pyruvoyltetrahydropterin/6-carboxytetrahydropterin synthase [Nonomuraea solani]